MALNFPDAPTLNQVFAPAGIDGSQWKWDGAKWANVGAGSGGTGLFLPVSGGAISGNLSVSGTETVGGLLTANGGIAGTATNNNAGAGQVGEFISNTNTAGSALGDTATVNITTISLTPGDWDVSGEVLIIIAGGGTASDCEAGINTSSGVFPGLPSVGASRTAISVGATLQGNIWLAVSPCRLSLATTTTVYLIAEVSGRTGTGYGKLLARRAR